MASQQGFEYEKNAIAFLTPLGLCDGKNAGASHTLPDLTLIVDGKTAGCELKITPTAGGSLVIKAYAKSTPHWRFGNVDHDESEKKFLVDLANSANIMSKINDIWSQPVFLVEDRDKEWENKMKLVPLRERYSLDLKTCPDIKIPLAKDAMSKYYNTKDTYYLNVGTHGFNLMGNNDPLNLNDKLRKSKLPLIPKFEDVATIIARVRCQSKGVTKADAQEKSKGTIGAQGYQFTFTMEFSVPKGSSPYNIAPINGSSVSILKDMAKKSLVCLGKQVK